MTIKIFRILAFIVGMFIISGCTTPTVDAGSDKTVQINKSIQIIGTVSNTNEKNITYLWKEGSTVLANSASFIYTPTTIGNHTLTFYVSDDKGNADNDSMVVTVEDDTPKIETIIIDKTSIELSEGNETKLSVTAHYNDNTSKDITSVVEWSIGDATVVSVVNGTLKALKEGNTTLKASYENKTSDIITVNIYKEINGYKLPPEPDPDVNNATLLGTDSNGNGVRDDVERWIYITYKDKHPIHVDIAMQAARAKQNMLKDPSKAKEIHDEMSASIDCESYYRVCVKEPNKKIHIRERINSKLLRSIIFNTKKRKDAYMQYNSLLSGDTYVIPWCSERKQLCDFDTTKYEK